MLLFQISATNLTILELENQQLEPSDIIVTTIATALNSHTKDDSNVTTKISSSEYLDSSKRSMEFDIYHPIANNYLLKTSESIQRDGTFILSGNLEKINNILLIYLTFIITSSSSNRTTTTSNTIEAARGVMFSIGNPQKKRKGKFPAASIRTKVKIPKLANLAIQRIDEDGECGTLATNNNDNREAECITQKYVLF